MKKLCKGTLENMYTSNQKQNFREKHCEVSRNARIMEDPPILIRSRLFLGSSTGLPALSSLLSHFCALGQLSDLSAHAVADTPFPAVFCPKSRTVGGRGDSEQC